MSTLRQRKPRTRTLIVWSVPTLLLLVVAAVLIARWLRDVPAVGEFIARYPGESGFPAWLGWQHYLNIFFLVLLVRSGWLIRTTARPQAYWTRNNQGVLRTKNPPNTISLNHWLHFSIDVLWLVNGAIFVVLLVATGQWMRIVPTSWDVFPNAVSVIVQYLSLDWPTENGWINYNGLQLLAYFAAVFVAAPLAAVSGLRMSPVWPKGWGWLNRAYPIELARKIHFPVMLYFLAFVVAHVGMVLATGALRNLNHMFAMREGDGLLGLWVFLTAMAVTIGAWFAVQPLVLRSVAGLTGKVSR